MTLLRCCSITIKIHLISTITRNRKRERERRKKEKDLHPRHNPSFRNVLYRSISILPPLDHLFSIRILTENNLYKPTPPKNPSTPTPPFFNHKKKNSPWHDNPTAFAIVESSVSKYPPPSKPKNKHHHEVDGPADSPRSP